MEKNSMLKFENYIVSVLKLHRKGNVVVVTINQACLWLAKTKIYQESQLNSDHSFLTPVENGLFTMTYICKSSLEINRNHDMKSKSSFMVSFGRRPL